MSLLRPALFSLGLVATLAGPALAADTNVTPPPGTAFLLPMGQDIVGTDNTWTADLSNPVGYADNGIAHMGFDVSHAPSMYANITPPQGNSFNHAQAFGHVTYYFTVNGPVGQTVMVVFVCSAARAVLNALVIVGGRTLYAA